MEVAEYRTGEDYDEHDHGGGPSQRHPSFRHAFIQRTCNLRNFGDDRHGQKALISFSLCKRSSMNSKMPAIRIPKAMPAAKPEGAEFEPVGKIGFGRKTGGIEDGEPLALLQLFHAGGHLRFIFLL